MKITPKFFDPTDITTLINKGTGKHVIADGLTTIPIYKGKLYSIKDVVNQDGTVNVRKAKKIMEEVAEYFGGKKMQHRPENPVWHKDDPNTWLHTKKVAKLAWLIPVPKGCTKQDLIVAALGHDFGKILSGDGHAEVSYNLIKLIFPDATEKQLNAIRKHMDPIQDLTKRSTKLIGSVLLKQFETFGKNIKRYKIQDSGKEVGEVGVILSPKDKTITIEAITTEKGKGYGQKAYEAISKEFPDYTIISDAEALSSDAEKMWDRLVQKNKAEKLGNKNYKYFTEPDTLMLSTKYADVGVVPGADLTTLGLTPEEISVIEKTKWFKKGGLIEKASLGTALSEGVLKALKTPASKAGASEILYTVGHPFIATAQGSLGKAIKKNGQYVIETIDREIPAVMTKGVTYAATKENEMLLKYLFKNFDSDFKFVESCLEQKNLTLGSKKYLTEVKDAMLDLMNRIKKGENPFEVLSNYIQEIKVNKGTFDDRLQITTIDSLFNKYGAIPTQDYELIGKHAYKYLGNPEELVTDARTNLLYFSPEKSSYLEHAGIDTIYTDTDELGRLNFGKFDKISGEFLVPAASQLNLKKPIKMQSKGVPVVELGRMMDSHVMDPSKIDLGYKAMKTREPIISSTFILDDRFIDKSKIGRLVPGNKKGGNIKYFEKGGLVYKLLNEMYHKVGKGVPLKDWSPELWDTIYNYVLKRYGGKDSNVLQRIRDYHFHTKAPNTEVKELSGKPLKVIHETDSNPFNVFDLERADKTDAGFRGKGVYFKGEKNPDVYGKNEIPAYLNITHSTSGGVPGSLDGPNYLSSLGRGSRQELINKALDNELQTILKRIEWSKKDSMQKVLLKLSGINLDASEEVISKLILKHLEKYEKDLQEMYPKDFDLIDGYIDLYEKVVYSPTQIKSSQAITKDDKGKIIPLSQRDDFTNKDMRYKNGGNLNKFQEGGPINSRWTTETYDPVDAIINEEEEEEYKLSTFEHLKTPENIEAFKLYLESHQHQIKNGKPNKDLELNLQRLFNLDKIQLKLTLKDFESLQITNELSLVIEFKEEETV